MKRRYRKKDNPFVTGFLLFVLLTSIYISINYVPKQFLTLERFPILFFVVFATTTLIAGITLIVTLKIWRKYTSKKKQEKESKPHKKEKKFLSPAEKEFKKYLRQNLPENIEIHCKVLPDEELSGVLRHELAHYRNRDGFWTPFFRTLTALLWFHPLAWKALARYETAAEWCCDEFAYLPNAGVPVQCPDAKCGSALLAKTFLVIHQNTESLALNLSTFARFNPVERVARLVRSETLGKETLMKKLLILGLLGLLFIGGMLHIQLVAQPSKTADGGPRADASNCGFAVVSSVND